LLQTTAQLLQANPLGVDLFRRYVQSRRDVKVYDFAGRHLNHQPVQNEGFYFIQENGNSPLEKMLVVK
jgi:hypothetical protein